MYYVYVLVEKASKERYIGFSSDLKNRIHQHTSGWGAKTTKRGTWNLVYYEAFVSESDARTRERRLKHDGRARYQLCARIQDSLAGQK